MGRTASYKYALRKLWFTMEKQNNGELAFLDTLY